MFSKEELTWKSKYFENNQGTVFFEAYDGNMRTAKGAVVTLQNSIHFLDGGGQMASSIRGHRWSTHHLGALDRWPSALKTAVSMVLNSKVPECIIWGPQFTAIYNDTFCSVLGDKPNTLGCSFQDIWSEAWTELGPIVDRAYAGEATYIEDFPLLIDRFGYTEQTYFTLCYSPVRDENGVIRGVLNTAIETTAKVSARQQTQLLNRELEHRIKNTLAVISAVINQTMHSAKSVHGVREILVQRIAALAQAQSLLTHSGSAEAGVQDVIEQALRPFEGATQRCHVAGPVVMLSSQQALALALAVNELGTNALKYGSLSNTTGEVHLTWDAGRPGKDYQFRLSWIEAGGPSVMKPEHKGFGSRIIERVLAQEFMGTVELTFDPAGLRCELRAPMARIGEGRNL